MGHVLLQVAASHTIVIYQWRSDIYSCVVYLCKFVGNKIELSIARHDCINTNSENIEDKIILTPKPDMHTLILKYEN